MTKHHKHLENDTENMTDQMIKLEHAKTMTRHDKYLEHGKNDKHLKQNKSMNFS